MEKKIMVSEQIARINRKDICQDLDGFSVNSDDGKVVRFKDIREALAFAKKGESNAA